MGAEWSQILSAAVQAQRWVPGAVCVGDTAAALYAGNRLPDHLALLLPTLQSQFDEVRTMLETHAEWTTTRVDPPVLIRGRTGKVAVQFRQPQRTVPVETQTVTTPAGPLVVTTLDELLCLKAFLAYSRQTTLDYLDFTALSECLPEAEVLASLAELDHRYGETQTAFVSLEVAKSLSACQPFDLKESKLPAYPGLVRKWHAWETTRSICQRHGVLLGEIVVGEGGKRPVRHRHLNTQEWSAAAVDSVLDRGDLPDWQALFAAVRSNQEVADLVLRVATAHALGARPSWLRHWPNA